MLHLDLHYHPTPMFLRNFCIQHNELLPQSCKLSLNSITSFICDGAFSAQGHRLKYLQHGPQSARFSSCNKSKSSHGTSRIESPVRMAYTSFRSTSASNLSNAPPILIMHGLLGSKTNWKSLGKIISQQTGRTVYTVDARNHGESPHTDEFSYYHLAEDISFFLREHSIPKACLMGHSMGGRAVMTLALTNPSVVEKLFVLDISPIGTSESISTLPRFVEMMRRVEIPPDLQLHEARNYVDEILLPIVPEKGIRLFLLSNLMKGDGGFSWKVNLESISKNFNPHISTFPPAKDGASFQGQTFFVGGALSNYIPPKDHDEIRSIFPMAKFSYVQAAGHWLHADKPQDFLEMISPLIKA
ncbi:UNVERIFIED_CONTAM: hypothetical protein GTU68_003938 [Idotea baltica]|nr:hypothetical protein [Idotea baltica]